MTLRQLRLFVAVAEELNFRKAAERAHITQPALSRHIQHLEAHLGVRLFERSAHRTTLTESGELLLTRMKPLLRELDAALSAVRRAASGEGRLRVGYMGPALYAVLPDVMSLFRERFPAVKVEMLEMANDEQVQALRDRSLDVGFIGQHALVEGLTFLPLTRDPYVLVVSKAHRLANFKIVPLKALDGQTLVSPRAREAIHEGFLERLSELGVHVQVQDVFGVDAVLNLVSAGLGVAFVPSKLRKKRHAGVTYRPVVPALADLIIGVATCKDEPLELVRAYLDAAKAASVARGERS